MKIEEARFFDKMLLLFGDKPIQSRVLSENARYKYVVVEGAGKTAEQRPLLAYVPVIEATPKELTQLCKDMETLVEIRRSGNGHGGGA